MSDSEGEWITVNGAHILLKEGERIGGERVTKEKISEITEDPENIKSAIENKINDLEKTKVRVREASGSSHSQKHVQNINGMINDATKNTEIQKEIDTLKNDIPLYEKSKRFNDAAGKLLERGAKKDGTKLTSDEMKMIRQEMTSNERLMLGIRKRAGI